MSVLEKKAAFLNAFTVGHARSKSWTLCVFSIKDTAPFSTLLENGKIVGDGKTITITTGDTSILASWWKPNTPLFDYKEVLELKAGDMVNVKAPIKTTYGRALVNQILLVETVGDKVPYQDGNWNKDKIINKVMDIVALGDEFTDQECHKFLNATQYITGFTQVCVPSASEKALSTDPQMVKRRNELLAKHKDQLDNPTVISSIEQELIAIDKAWLKDDPSSGFYLDGKAFNVARKRMHIMHGGERDFIDSNKMATIPVNLNEGWDMDQLPMLVNAIRDGTYSRGAATALGGEKVKKFQQAFQNARVSERDCKSKKLSKVRVTDYNYMMFDSRYIQHGATVKLITSTELKAMIGKTINLRSPLYCKTAKTDFCEVCVGEAVAKHPDAINMLAATIGSVFMLLEMKRAHGSELATVNYNPFMELN